VRIRADEQEQKRRGRHDLPVESGMGDKRGECWKDGGATVKNKKRREERKKRAEADNTPIRYFGGSIDLGWHKKKLPLDTTFLLGWPHQQKINSPYSMCSHVRKK
jgi:hypothetical protein